jgi:hypothetical protein
MPKRVIDFDALWASDKLAACAEWAQPEYAWLYGLADCAGCFELSNLRVIWGRVGAIRRNFSMERLEQVLDEFQDKGLLFVWNESGKRYGHWTGSDVPGRLPPASWRNRLERLAPAVPREQFAKYVAAHSVGVKNKSRCESLPDGTSAACGRELNAKEMQAPVEFDATEARVEPVGLWRDERSAHCSSVETASICPPRRANGERPVKKRESSRGRPLKACLEEPQGQDLGLNLDLEGNREKQIHTHVLQDAKSVCAVERSAFKEKQKPFDEKPSANAKANADAEDQTNSQTLKINENATETAQLSASANASPEAMRQIWQQERGALPEVRALSPEREARCRERIAHARNKNKSAAQFLADFRDAVTRAAATPFLCGEGPAGWRANFDWLVANDTNYLKVLEGRYDAGAGISAAANNSGSATDGLSASSGRAGSWAAHAMARDEAVRRELSAGAGPSSTPNSTRIRAGVIDRALHRA